MRNAFAHETLDAAPEAPPRARRARTVAQALFAIEPLPEDPPPAPRPRGPGVLGLLLAPERLPEDPVEPSRRRRPWLAWLFRPESLDPP